MNKKNIKIIISFYLCSIIILSATKTICAEKKSSFTYNFSSIKTLEEYTKAASTLPNNKSTKNVIIKCDICSAERSGKFSVAYSNMSIHREIYHDICRHNKYHKKSKCNCQAKPSGFPLSFSSINTPEKYRAKLPKIATKYVTITCDKCNRRRRGLFTVAYINMLRHLEIKHCTCRYNELHETSEDAKNCEDCRAASTIKKTVSKLENLLPL